MAVRQRNQAITSPVAKPAAQNFVRNAADVGVGDSVKDGQRRSGSTRGAVLAGPNQIPVNTARESRALVSLRLDSRSLLGLINNMPDPQRGQTFYSPQGELALVRNDGQGMAEILVNGKPAFKCFNDNFYPGATHVMMAGPQNRMYAGRDLPPAYLAQANALVGHAHRAISGLGS
ncbi:hypothetical protein ACSFA3_11555 [Variovorax sp. RHLX14]|uniref:hypothetical protein n=1 Tax=Variovorax sp. RHLX14 TaxID=1259731 RepID=UPI003F46B87B